MSLLSHKYHYIFLFSVLGFFIGSTNCFLQNPTELYTVKYKFNLKHRNSLPNFLCSDTLIRVSKDVLIRKYRENLDNISTKDNIYQSEFKVFYKKSESKKFDSKSVEKYIKSKYIFFVEYHPKKIIRPYPIIFYYSIFGLTIGSILQILSSRKKHMDIKKDKTTPI